LITVEDAERIVEELIHSAYRNRFGEERVVVDGEYTVERDYGWLFAVNTVGFVRTRDPEKGLVGNGPLLVLRDGGGIVRFSSAFFTPDMALAAYERDPGQFPVERLASGDTTVPDEVRIARVFAQPTASVGDSAHAWIADDEERRRVASYLRAGSAILMTTALQPDLIEPARGRVVGASFRTDGSWVWSDALTYYADAYGLAPEDAFYAHIRDRGYACPVPGDAAQDNALNVLYASFRR